VMELDEHASVDGNSIIVMTVCQRKITAAEQQSRDYF